MSTSEEFSKWAIFPSQHEMHTKATSLGSAEVKNMDTSKFIAHENFWNKHGILRGLAPSTEMKLKQFRTTKKGINSVTQRTYNQMIDGVKVFGGEFRMTVGAHGGVVNAHGLPLRSSSQREYTSVEKEDILARPLDESLQQALFSSVESHVLLSRGLRMTVEGLVPDPASSSGASRPIELVWYSPTMAKGRVQEGSWALSYFLRGVRVTTSTAPSPSASTTSNGDVKISMTPPVTMYQRIFCTMSLWMPAR